MIKDPFDILTEIHWLIVGRNIPDTLWRIFSTAPTRWRIAVGDSLDDDW